MADFIYLASQSPRRRQLLEQLGVRHELLLPDAHEDAEGIEEVLPKEAPATYVQRVTQLKLDMAVQRMKRRGLPAAPILCSDTTVALGRKIYGKPADAQDAAQARSLSDTCRRARNSDGPNRDGLCVGGGPQYGAQPLCLEQPDPPRSARHREAAGPVAAPERPLRPPAPHPATPPVRSPPPQSC